MFGGERSVDEDVGSTIKRTSVIGINVWSPSKRAKMARAVLKAFTHRILLSISQSSADVSVSCAVITVAVV